MQLKDENISYLYFGGGLNINTASPDEPIACDKPDEHIKYGNVLYADGHVQGYSGANWMEAAGIKKIPAGKSATSSGSGR